MIEKLSCIVIGMSEFEVCDVEKIIIFTPFLHTEISYEIYY